MEGGSKLHALQTLGGFRKKGSFYLLPRALPAMKSTAWTKAIKECADPHRSRHFFELLAATNAGPTLQQCSLEQARVFAALFSGSRAGANLLVSQPEWLGALDAQALKFPRRKQGFAEEGEGLLGPLLEGRDYSAALGR